MTLCLLGKPSKQRVGGYTGYTHLEHIPSGETLPHDKRTPVTLMQTWDEPRAKTANCEGVRTSQVECLNSKESTTQGNQEYKTALMIVYKNTIRPLPE